MKNTEKDDTMIDEIRKDVKKILKILNGNGEVGFCERVRNNETKIKTLEGKPKNIKNWLVAGAVIINTILLGLSLGGII